MGALVVVARVAVGVLFVATGAAKLRAGPLTVMRSIGAYKLLPERWTALMPRRGSTMQTAIAAGAIVAVAWILDAAGLLDRLVTSDAARIGVVAVIVALQIATLLALALLTQRRRRPS